MNDILIIALSLALSITAGLIYIPGIVIISKHKNLYDQGGGRKPHKGNIPRTAGLAFFPTFILAFFIPMVVADLAGWWSGSDIRGYILEAAMLLTGLSLLYMMGFVDDLIGVSWRRKFAVQFLAALMPLAAGMGVTDLDGLLGMHEVHPLLGAALTVFAVMLVVNAYNLIDGIDGLCSSLSFFATVMLGAWFVTHGMPGYALIAASIAGITAVYFYYNTTHTRFRTFMGDTGSTNLAYIIVFLALTFYNRNTGAAADIDWHPMAILLGLMSLPLLDTARVFAVRISKGMSPFHPDKRHLHHKLLELGLTHLQCTLICFTLQACTFGINYLLQEVNINIVVAADLAFMLLYTLVIDALVHRRVAARLMEKKQENGN